MDLDIHRNSRNQPPIPNPPPRGVSNLPPERTQAWEVLAESTCLIWICNGKAGATKTGSFAGGTDGEPDAAGNRKGTRSHDLWKTGEMAEGEGFEPPVAFRLLLISSQVPLTTQPPFPPLTTSCLTQV